MFFFLLAVNQDQLLHEAAIKNDIPVARYLIEKGVGINSKTHVSVIASKLN